MFFQNTTKRTILSLARLKPQLLIAQLCFLIIGLFCAPIISSAAAVYSEINKSTQNYNELEQLHSIAFAAYLNEDYQTAFQKWTEAAKKKHAKSLFNLALMHDRNQVPNGGSSKTAALDLYKRSANRNYLPAYQYWARMVEKDNPELAQRIRNILHENSPESQLESQPQQRLQLNKTTGNVATATSQENTHKQAAKVEIEPEPEPKDPVTDSLHQEQWISQHQDTDWTIQIVAYENETQVLHFADQHDLLEKGAYFTETSAGRTWFKLILGSFSSKQAADQARNNLPDSVRGEGPWLRQFKGIKAAIK